MRDFESYFDSEGKQVKLLPKKWTDASRFKVGDHVQYLENQRWSFKRNGGNLQGMIGTVTKVNPGYGPFPSEWRTDSDDFGFWVGQHAGWLTVDFGPDVVFGERTVAGQRVPETRRAMTLDEEGRRWRKLSAKTTSSKNRKKSVAAQQLLRAGKLDPLYLAAFTAGVIDLEELVRASKRNGWKPGGQENKK